MFKSKFISRITAAALLTGALVADAYQIGVVVSDGQGQYVQEAALLKMATGKKLKDQQGNFKGCVVPGDECVIFYMAFGEVTLSSEGLHIQ